MNVLITIFVLAFAAYIIVGIFIGARRKWPEDVRHVFGWPFYLRRARQNVGPFGDGLIGCENPGCEMRFDPDSEGVSAYGMLRFCSDECAYEFPETQYATSEEREYVIPLLWQEWGVRKVRARSLAEACRMALDLEVGLPSGEFIDDSLEIEMPGLDLYNEDLPDSEFQAAERYVKRPQVICAPAPDAVHVKMRRADGKTNADDPALCGEWLGRYATAGRETDFAQVMAGILNVPDSPICPGCYAAMSVKIRESTRACVLVQVAGGVADVQSVGAVEVHVVDFDYTDDDELARLIARLELLPDAFIDAFPGARLREDLADLKKHLDPPAESRRSE